MDKFFIHLKTSQVYEVVSEAIDCTNSRMSTPVIIYKKAATPEVDAQMELFNEDSSEKPIEQIFVREKEEFFEKFSPLSDQY